MARPTPFHPRTSELCHSLDWRQWSGYFSPTSYNDFIQPEYASIRHSSALIDVSPLYKYDVEGPDAAALLDRVMTHHIAKMEVGQVLYTPWCNGDGKIRQEGTIFRLGESRFQVNATEPTYGWLRRAALGFDVRLRDCSAELAALSLQGPRSRDVLRAAGFDKIDDLRFFRVKPGQIGGVPVTVSRTGYTGDLGYEVWMPTESALTVWDVLIGAGKPYQITPCGLAAMDISRIEAGFVLLGVDYASAETAVVEADKMTPYELGMGWAVKLDKGPFIGRDALAREKAKRKDGDLRGLRRLVGVEIGWTALEELYLGAGVMPDLPQTPCREPVPIYRPYDLDGGGGEQIGRVTTRVWSTLLKKYIGLATVDADSATTGSEVEMEVTVRYARRRVAARLVDPPFFRPERMRA